MDLDRITHPLRLAKGSDKPGSGKGCAMNAISYINGDTAITDFPERSARPLAEFVQLCNDLLAGPDGYLSPENSLLTLELGWQTVGTADVDDVVVHAWVTEGTKATSIVELARHVIRTWRDLAGLDTQSDLSWTSVGNARQLIGVSAYPA